MWSTLYEWCGILLLSLVSFCVSVNWIWESGKKHFFDLYAWAWLRRVDLYVEKRAVDDSDSVELDNVFWNQILANKNRDQEMANQPDDIKRISFFANLYANREKFRLKHYHLEHTKGAYLTMVCIKHGPRADFEMCEMNALFGMPRGCVVTWVHMMTEENGARMRVSGFWGKFNNDKDEGGKYDNVFRNVTRATFFRKYSGFLSGAVLIPNEGGLVRWTCTSKNDANETSSYVKGARALWGKILTQSTLFQLNAEGLHSLWGEALMKNDSVHGAEVQEEGIVMTAGSYCVERSALAPTRKGTVDLVSIAQSDRLTFVAKVTTKCENTTKTKPCLDALLETFDCESLFCKHSHMDSNGNWLLNMEIVGWKDLALASRLSESAFAVDIAAHQTLTVNHDSVRLFPAITALSSVLDTPVLVPRSMIKKFKKELDNNRDWMTESLLQTLLENLGLPTESMHTRLLGNTLEGLVLHLELDDGSVVTIKYKFPQYTMRTFLFRVEGCVHGVYQRLGMEHSNERMWLPSRRFSKAIEDFISRWITSPENEDKIRSQIVAIAEEFDAMVSAHDAETREATNVGIWISASDTVEPESHKLVPLPSKILTRRMRNARTLVGFIVVLGPIGVGKSLAADAIARELKCCHVDGDQLFSGNVLFDANNPSTKHTFDAAKLEKYRACTTTSVLVNTIGDKGCVVLSCGGGVLGKGSKKKWTCTILEQLASLIPEVEIELSVCLPSETGWGFGKALSEEDINRLYTDSDSVRAAVRSRLTRGVWVAEIRKGNKKTDKTDPATPTAASTAAFEACIVAKSCANSVFASRLQKCADKVYTFPRACPFTGKQTSLSTSRSTLDALKDTPKYDKEDMKVHISQLRLLHYLPEEERVCHETLYYGTPKCESFGVLSSGCQKDTRLGFIEHQTRIYVNGENGFEVIVANADVPDGILCCQQAGMRHITIDANAHQARAMKAVAMHFRSGKKSPVIMPNQSLVDLALATVTPVETYAFAVIAI